MTDERLMRTELVLGAKGIENLKKSTVVVIGIGAVGGYALEALARAGVGHLILVDFDVFEPSNINRQILALSSTLGQKKVTVAQKRVMEINPYCKVELKDMFVNNENIEEIIKFWPDYVVDAIDSIKEKCDLMEALQKANIPFISSMGAALKTDIFALREMKLSKTYGCAMAKKIRQSLKKRGVDTDKIRCVCSTENLQNKPIAENPDGGRPVLGSLPSITAVMGLMLAHLVILDLAKGE